MALLSISAIIMLVVCVSARDFPNCQSGPLSTNKVCDTTLSPWARASAQLVAEFTVSEKSANSGDNSPGVPRLGVPPYEWWQEALHGVAGSPGVSFAPSGDFSYATSFPQPITMGAAFDLPLIRSVADVISTEARAFSNAGRTGLNFWTPNINPYRDPRWGRGQEVPSEDAFFASQYINQLIPGLQGGDPSHNADNPYYKLVATCKHYAGYDIENWQGNERYGFDAIITRQDLQDYYLAPFRACARDADAQSFMCSYNAVNGVPTCADPWLLQDVLRDQYGFSTSTSTSNAAKSKGKEEDNDEEGDRWVTSDCDAIKNVWNDHHYGASAADAAARSLNAGTDLDCGSFWPQNLAAALRSNLTTEATLDKSLVRRYASMVRLGWFDAAADQPYRRLTWADVATPDAKALALRAAVEGIVLLQNKGDTLPLDPSPKKVAVIGPLGSATTQLQGNYFGRAQSVTSVVAAFKGAGWSVTAVQGTSIAGSSTSGFPAAVSAAQAADVIVYVGGIDNSQESETRDRNAITWPGQQLALIYRLAAVKGEKPLVVIQLGTMVDSSSLVSGNDTVDALVWAGYPGQSGGQAIVDILLGTSAPAGRLPVTQYPASLVNQIKMTNMDLRPGAGNPGQTYKWYNSTAVFPFAHGLHYTTFNATFSSASALPPTFSTADLTGAIPFNATGPPGSGNYPDLAPFATVGVAVSNTGTGATNVTSDYVVLLFARGEHGPEPRPNKSLVALPLTLGALARGDADGNLVLWPGKYTLALDVDERDTWEFEITGDEVVLEKLAPARASEGASGDQHPYVGSTLA
ncbi:Xylan 1-4-beta-xylosidase [Apiospora aurea]|uniref:xylan 1,4-beta-xylosidase n=1 Tax=Apiospora aurea TaxID=335848 RepID=A0ABR1QRE0_9PEZI